jgi:hypothetical protein
MIIGEQRLGGDGNNYYENYNNNEGNHQYEVLKRKLSSENDNDLSNYNNSGDRSEVATKNCTVKMHYVDNSITETYHTYQTIEQIHQDGDQSYINLTVMTPTATLIHYDKNQQEPHQAFVATSIREDHHHQQQQQQVNPHNTTKQASSSANIGKFEVRNYQHQQQQQSGEQILIYYYVKYKPPVK